MACGSTPTANAANAATAYGVTVQDLITQGGSIINFAGPIYSSYNVTAGSATVTVGSYIDNTNYKYSVDNLPGGYCVALTVIFKDYNISSHACSVVLDRGVASWGSNAVSTAVMGGDPLADRGQSFFADCDNTIKLAQAAGIGTGDLSRIELPGLKIKEALFDYGPRPISTPPRRGVPAPRAQPGRRG